MAASNTMYVLNERARFACNNVNAAVKKTQQGFEVFTCAFRFHGIPLFSTRGIVGEVFADEASLEKHFRTLILKDIQLAQLERLTQKAREAYADSTVTVRRKNGAYVINHHEAQTPAYVFRSRPHERKIRDILVARQRSRIPTPSHFDSLEALTRALEDRIARQLADAALAGQLRQATVQAQRAFEDHGARVIEGKRATDRFKFLIVLSDELEGQNEFPFESLAALTGFLDGVSGNGYRRRRIANDPASDFQEKEAALST